MGFNTETAILANSNNGNEKLDVPILLVREEDSVVFPTSLSFTYSLTGWGNIIKILFCELWIRDEQSYSKFWNFPAIPWLETKI